MNQQLPVIPDELLLALAREQRTTTTTNNNNNKTKTITMNNNNKETIWNRIGFTSNSPITPQRQQPTPNDIPTITKKPSTKQQQPRQRRNRNHKPLSSSSSPTPTPTPPPPLPPSHHHTSHNLNPSTPTQTVSSKARASFSLDHYITHHHLGSSQDKKSPNAESTKSRSRFLGAEIINGIFSSSSSSQNNPPAQIDQPATRTSSINASKHFNISRASVDQLFPISSPSPSKPTSQTSQNKKSIKQPSLDHSHRSPLSRPILPSTNISSSTPLSLTLQDEIAEDDLNENNAPPWGNRETFTHELRANRPEDRLLIPTDDPIDHSHQPPPFNPPNQTLKTNNIKSETVGISRIPIPINPITRPIHQAIPPTPFIIPPSTSHQQHLSHHLSIPPTSARQDRSRSRSQSVFSLSTPSTSHSPIRTPHSGLRHQINTHRTLEPEPDTNRDPQSLFLTSPISLSPTSTRAPQQEQRTVSAAYTVPLSTSLLLSNPNTRSSRGRSLSDTFVRKTRSLIGIPPPDPPRYSIHSPLQSFNLTKPIPSQLAKQIILKDLLLASNTTHPPPDPHHQQQQQHHHHPLSNSHHELLKLFQSNKSDMPSESSVLTSESCEDQDDDDDEEEALSLIDSPQVTQALNVKADFVIAVAGPKGVGKSTIISKALRKPLGSQNSVVLYHDSSDNRITSLVSNIVSKNISYSAQGQEQRQEPKVLQVLEIDQPILADKCISTKRAQEGLSWPGRLPHLDGVLLCYDATDPNALDHLRPLLHSFWTRGGISLIVLACKSDKEEKNNATSPLKAAELVNVYGTGMIQLDGGVDDPGKKMRNSFNWIVKAIKEARGEHRSYSSASSTNILGSIYGDEEEEGSRPSSIVPRRKISEGERDLATEGGRSDEEEELDQESESDQPGHPNSAGTPVTSCGRTPRKTPLTPPLAASGELFDISTPGPSSTRLFISSSSPTLASDPLLHIDDADGDSFSNNALVAMSYEKSTRPDGSFMHGGSTPGSPREISRTEPSILGYPIASTSMTVSEKTSVVDQTPFSLAPSLFPTQPHPSASSSDSPPQPQNLPGQEPNSSRSNRALDPAKALSGSGKHAVQKAIAMSQRGVDMDLHFEKHVIIDKFVFATVSGNEPSFVDQFLIIFRRFATPFEVLSALIFRFDFVSTHIDKDPILGRYAHLKICHVLMSWLEIYPGDFAQPATLTVLKAFNSLMISVTWLLHYAIEIMPMIKMIGNMTDEDVGWALPDSTDESAVKGVIDCVKKLQSNLATSAAGSSVKSRGSVVGESNEDPPLPMTPLTTGKSVDYPRSEASPHLDKFSSTFMSNDHLASTAASSPVHSFSPHDRQHLPTPIKSNEEHKPENLHHPLCAIDSTENFIAATLPLKSTLTSSSFQSDHKADLKFLHDSSILLLSIPEESIALQITRLEWNIFSQMKPRHLIRYVLAPRDPNNPRKALRDPNSPIAKSTDYLNYLAVWASSMILIQEKLKSRARVLLKLMKVAYELRDMDDFHSLMGVLAGIEAQPVYRLDATFEVVQHMDLQSYRRYLSLKKLMSSQRSFSAYRLARQTASSQCVPYLGTYLQDITAVNEVKDDMKDGKVNLTKMIQIAKSASAVINCNLLAPKIVFDPKISNLIIKIPVLSEDAQYELSYKYKPRLQSSSHYSSNPNGNSGGGVGAGGSSGGIMSVLAAATATTTTPTTTTNAGASGISCMVPVTGGGHSSDPTNPTGPTGPLTSSVSSGSLIPGASSTNLFSSSTTGSSPSTATPTSNNNHLPGSSAIHTVANVGAATSLVAKKGTRKLKQLLSTAITHNSSANHHSQSFHPSNPIGHSNH